MSYVKACGTVLGLAMALSVTAPAPGLAEGSCKSAPPFDLAALKKISPTEARRTWFIGYLFDDQGRLCLVPAPGQPAIPLSWPRDGDTGAVGPVGLEVTGPALDAATNVNVPDIGEPADLVMSPLEEQRLGTEVMRQLLASGYVLEDPELTTYIRSIGQRLARHTNHSPDDFHFFVVKDGGINAFALPGGFIGINAGLLIASETESELAGVVAHEISHVTQRHIARQIDKSSGWNLASTALLIAALIAGIQDPEIAQAALGVGLSAAAQQQINFTRAHEKEADRIGIGVLADAGFDPEGMGDFFHRLSQKAQLYGEGVPEILRTHPVSTNRIAEAQARAAALPRHEPGSSLQYQLMRSRARVLMTELDGDALSHFRGLNRYGGDVSEVYGLALALERNRAFADAKSLLDRLIDQQPDQPSLLLARGRLQAEAGAMESAVSTLRRAHKQHPKYGPLTLGLAQTQIRAGQARDARQLLLESDLLLVADSEVFRLLALAAREMEDPAEAHFQMAAYERSRGNYVAALRQLRSALRLKELSQHDTERLEGRLAQYLAEAPESERKRSEQIHRERN
mgnify:CR=1 FL=1